jgi:hypothetical protein
VEKTRDIPDDAVVHRRDQPGKSSLVVCKSEAHRETEYVTFTWRTGVLDGRLSLAYVMTADLGLSIDLRHNGQRLAANVVDRTGLDSQEL